MDPSRCRNTTIIHLATLVLCPSVCFTLQNHQNLFLYWLFSVFQYFISHYKTASCLMKVSGNNAIAVHGVHFYGMKFDVMSACLETELCYSPNITAVHCS